MDTGEQLRLIKEIIEKHLGRENPISSGKIGPEIGIHEGDTHAQVRGLILEAIEKLKIPIGAGSRGYYLIRDEDELRENAGGIDNRISGMQRRKNLIEEAFREYYE